MAWSGLPLVRFESAATGYKFEMPSSGRSRSLANSSTSTSTMPSDLNRSWMFLM